MNRHVFNELRWSDRLCRCRRLCCLPPVLPVLKQLVRPPVLACVAPPRPPVLLRLFCWSDRLFCFEYAARAVHDGNRLVLEQGLQGNTHHRRGDIRRQQQTGARHCLKQLGPPAGMDRKIVLASKNTLMAGMERSRISGW